MPRILKNIRIDEVSAVLKGAGEGTRIMLMKSHDDSADGDADWHREQARIADEQNELHLRKHARNWRSFNDVLAENVVKSFAAVARGDEADLQDEQTSADELVDGGSANDHHASKVADLLVESGKHPTRQAALDHLLHTARGAALLRRLTKQHQEESTMSKEELETERTARLDEVVKAYGIMPLAKQMIAEGSSYGIDESEFTKLATAHAQRLYPDMTPAAAFEKLFSDGSEDGVILREAHGIAKNAYAAPMFDLKPMFVGADDALDVDNPAKAIAQLQEIGRQKWPSASEAAQFENAFTDPANAELAAKAHRRPAATTTYPFPR
jgi:hypothetical protein